MQNKQAKYKLIITATVISLSLLATNAVASPGYLNTYNGSIVRSAYGTCVRTAFFNRANDGLAQCDDKDEPAAVVTQPHTAPTLVATEPSITEVYQSVTFSDSNHVLFSFNSNILTNAGKELINNFAKSIANKASIQRITVNGYSDAIGGYSYNMRLSTKRAMAVKELLIQDGYAANKINIEGYGPQQATTSQACFSKYNRQQIFATLQGIHKKMQAAQKMSKARLAKLKTKMQTTQKQYDALIACTAKDRKVVISIHATKQQALPSKSEQTGNTSNS